MPHSTLTVPDALNCDLERAYDTAVGDGTDPLSPQELYDSIRDAYSENGKNDKKIKDFLRGKRVNVDNLRD